MGASQQDDFMSGIEVMRRPFNELSTLTSAVEATQQSVCQLQGQVPAVVATTAELSSKIEKIKEVTDRLLNDFAHILGTHQAVQALEEMVKSIGRFDADRVRAIVAAAEQGVWPDWSPERIGQSLEKFTEREPSYSVSPEQRVPNLAA